MMPAGLEKDLSVADVADLFAYLAAQGRATQSGERSSPAIDPP